MFFSTKWPDFPRSLSFLLLLELLLVARSTRAQVGVNWGTQVSHRLRSSSVVEMLEDNGFSRVKLFEADDAILHALGGTNLEVMVGIPNEMIDMLSSSMHAAGNWVARNVTWYLRFPKKRVNIRYVAIGDEPLRHGVTANSVVGAVRNIRAALNRQKRTSIIQTTVPFSASVVTSTNFSPSSGTFVRPNDVKAILEVLSASKSPFTVNIHPFFSKLQDPNFPPEFTFFDGQNVLPLEDEGRNYTNAFDATFDTVVSALEHAGFPNMQIIVGGTGWPTDCHVDANPGNARRYNQGLVDKIKSSRGTPRRPGQLHAYIFSLVDEDRKIMAHGARYERHWGIFWYDGNPKYDLVVENSRTLKNVADVVYMPQRWCILDSAKNPGDDVLEQRINETCRHVDCNTLYEGGSCQLLTVRDRASYAFNSDYQFNDQAASSCDFDFGIVTRVDPSLDRTLYGNCRFIRQIATSSVQKHRLCTLLLIVLLIIQFAKT